MIGADKHFVRLCREQLELLEDKLRDFKSLRENQYDDKVLL